MKDVLRRIDDDEIDVEYMVSIEHIGDFPEYIELLGANLNDDGTLNVKVKVDEFIFEFTMYYYVYGTYDPWYIRDIELTSSEGALLPIQEAVADLYNIDLEDVTIDGFSGDAVTENSVVSAFPANEVAARLWASDQHPYAFPVVDERGRRIVVTTADGREQRLGDVEFCYIVLN